MTAATKTQNELLAENEDLRLRLEEAEDTLRAIGSGEVDAFVVSGTEGEQQVFTLKGAELPYRILVESMNEGAVTLAADGTILYCNKRLASMLKIPLENLIGTKLGSYVEPDSCLTYAALLDNCTQESISEEITLTTVTGNSIPVFMSCCANDISGTQGKSIVVTDLTLQRRNTEMLAAEKFSSSIIEQSNEVVIVCDTKGKIIRASQSAHALCGTNPLLKQFNKLFPLRIAGSGKKFSLVQLKSAGKLTSFEVEYKKEDKQTFNLLLNATYLKNLRNMDIGSIVTLTDITGRKTAEMELQQSEVRLQSAYSHLQIINEELQVTSEELKAQSDELQNKNTELQELLERSQQSEEAVRKSEERLALATSATKIGMFDQDLINGKTLWTQTHEAIFGYAPTTTTTTTTEHDQSRWTDRVHPDDLPLIDEESRRCMLESKPLVVQYRIVWPDGSLHWVETKGVYHYESDGTASRMIGVVRDITDIKQAEEALAEAHRQNQSIIDNTQAIVYALDLEERFILANASVATLLNSTPAQIIGKRRHNFMSQTDADRHEANDRMVIKAGRAQDFEEQSELPGRSITWLTTKFPLKDATGKIYAVGGISTDITERKLTEIALRESEQRIQQALHVSRSFTFDWLTDTDKVIRSASCATILKLTGDEAVNDTGEHFFQCVHPDDRTRFGQILHGLTPAANCYLTDYRYVCNDGSEITLEETGQALFDSTGKMLRLVGVSTDISARKQAEEALMKINSELELRIEERTSDLAKAVKILEEEIHEHQKAELKLQRLNRLYTVLSETNQTIVKIIDRESLFREFCRIAVEHGGFILSWIGLVDWQSGKVSIVASSGVTAYLDDVRISAKNEPEGEGPTGIVIRGGSYYISNDFQNDPCTRPWHEQGRKHGICASASIAIKENDRVIGALTLYAGEKDYFDEQQVKLLLQMGMDISFAIDNLNREYKRRKAEKALYEETSERLMAVETLREKEHMLIQQSRQAAMGEMIGNIAHQWRQPLNTLGLYTQRLGMFYGSPNFNKEFLDKSIAKSMEIIKHMSKTIDDFRDYFKPEKEKADFYVVEAIKNTLSLLESNFHNPKITIDFVDRANPVINGYQNEFAQVFLNILNNARDAMVERKIADGRITITICSENGRAIVTVSDNAGGIPDEVINKVFDPYFTTKGPQVGTGIGLFMSKTIIEKNMGGSLTVHNTGTGAEFRIEVGHGTQN